MLSSYYASDFAVPGKIVNEKFDDTDSNIFDVF